MVNIKYYLIRHAQSDYNVDKDVRLTTLDWQVNLTNNGIDQSIHLGKWVNRTIPREDNTVNFMFSSTFNRALQTSKIMMSEISNVNLKYKTDPLIVEQRTPLYYGTSEKQSYDILTSRNGHDMFFSKIYGYESPKYVYDRSILFINKLSYIVDTNKSKNINFYIVSHGFFLKTLTMSICNLSVSEFSKLKNPKHGEVICIDEDKKIKYLNVIS